MARPATSRIKLNPPLGRLPTLQFLRPGEIRVDPAYQRSVEAAASITLIRRMAQHWNWDLCQPLVIARRHGASRHGAPPSGQENERGDISGGDHYYVIDGQHRLAAARLRGDIDQLPCVIVAYDNAADEAASFVHLNQQRRPLTKLDLYRAAVASLDPRASAIAQAMVDAGLTLAPHSNVAAWKPGVIANIGGIERIWERDGALAATRALDALGHAFRGQVLRYCGTLYRAIAQVCADEIKAHREFRGERFERFLALLARQSQDDWMAAIKHHFAVSNALFTMEAAAGLMRQEWRREIEPKSAAMAIQHLGQQRSQRTMPAPGLPARQGFGLGASDFAGDQAWAWCGQCDKRRSQQQVTSCSSRFCKLKVAG